MCTLDCGDCWAIRILQSVKQIEKERAARYEDVALELLQKAWNFAFRFRFLAEVYHGRPFLI
jgi:hypothetical protein